MSDASKEEKWAFLREGEIDPVFNRKVELLILQAASLFVYIDDRLQIQWRWNATADAHAAFGKVLNRQAYLESKARFITDREQKLHIQRMIAEGMARFMTSLSLERAQEIHDLVEIEIRECSIRTSWQWYFTSAYWLAVACVASLVLGWCLRAELRPLLGATGFDVMCGTLMGSVGALLSIASRGDRITLDANAGAILHRTEGLARVLVGMAGALLVALAFKGGLLLDSFKSTGSAFAALLLLCFIAGASERLVPSLIAKVEAAHSGAKPKVK